jgi:alkylation response protein AidB-like acyl-CoA dehydrogenase
MEFELTEEQRILQDQIRRFAEVELNAGVRERDSTHRFSREAWDKCAAMGLQGLPVPEEYGGAGLSALSSALALEALGRGCRDSGLTFAICAHLLACVVPIWKFGSQEQKSGVLPDLCTGRKIAVNAMTEQNAGSDPFGGMATRAAAVEGGFIVNGSKIFGSNAPIADVVLLYAVTDAEKRYYGGITAFIVEHGTPGLSRGQSFEKMGLRTCPIGETLLEDVFVPDSAVVGGVGGGATVFAHSMEWERILLVACHVGVMERLLDEAIRYARERRQYGQPIGKFQAISHKIADMKVRLEAARLLAYRAAWRLDRTKEVALDASITKLFVSEALLKTALDTVQIYGGHGYMTENDVERSLRDAAASTLYSGTSEIQRNIIARWLGL